MVYEARGQFREAADCYRKVIEFTRANAENYDAGFTVALAREEAAEVRVHWVPDP